ncbi:NapH/MauN family ferredoxin-type protein [Sedimenticola selenatireducens]|jgi:ferredoxin-type protein NapH|uniref:NapH/MauN family ferredoxin-type protein n=1 Tax=Sedimenticola selenatireducens TaxID=191960 RepID=A0A557S4W6_9GAMM|nr:NapH/MauN family ferredoxin-type protein [Sedimenticola selenatireducens]TVO72456.1 NapH/MauN family ferredoxin-type protein [Sedimenticola selenatireducens]TVT64711.1 MAG: NapH/MauN family ferredoxin-type protein [Sedimenticola selenatireducens]
MSYIIESFRQLYGSDPRRPAKTDISPEAQKVHFDKKQKPYTKEEIAEVEALHAQGSKKWRNRRWATLIFINVLFLVSYYFDIQLLEGALTASRFMGFHMADLNSALQVTLAFKHMVLNLVIGTVTVIVIWLLLGGRTFCSWVCPYHLLSEWAESLHLFLAKKGIVKDRTFNRKVRSVFYLLFALLALGTGYTVFETISVTGIVSRALIYGPGVAMIWVGLVLLFEVFYSRRAWCRYVCPIGITYGVVGTISPLRVKFLVKDCHHEGECRKVCLVPHVLDVTIKGRAAHTEVDVSADCTRCGMCIDICPTNSLRFEIKGLGKHL